MLIAPVTAEATLMAERSLDEQVAKADLIVIGVVTRQHSYAVGKTIMTDTTVRIEQTLKGKSQLTIEVTQLGGRIDNRVVEVVGDAVLRPGQRLLLMTYVHADGGRYLVGMALGAILLDDDPQPACGLTGGSQTTDTTTILPNGELSHKRSDVVYVAEVMAAIARVIHASREEATDQP
ncbi:MAG: hypothetical protein A2289_17855 [Deltaproteobacteria bacterium RIFOXYA12_FULL_58_15]|nr:MAG: hypothetical protein A2289_17855 [Deltaproteobacteria bacterium RIFOXYA12_FULL_58_15]OGR12491.1 MAG: hypothetical protein A2341_19830 [Deltaproteobacteria bacterium RIFOXYB12_FULL_58_9]